MKKEVEVSYLAQEAIAQDRRSAHAWAIMGNCFSLQKVPVPFHCLPSHCVLCLPFHELSSDTMFSFALPPFRYYVCLSIGFHQRPCLPFHCLPWTPYICFYTAPLLPLCLPFHCLSSSWLLGLVRTAELQCHPISSTQCCMRCHQDTFTLPFFHALLLHYDDTRWRAMCLVIV